MLKKEKIKLTILNHIIDNIKFCDKFMGFMLVLHKAAKKAVA